MNSGVTEVLEVSTFRGAAAPSDGAPGVLIEIPHGATRTSDFERLAARLTSPLPKGLVDFFHVNTDVGAPELARAVAERFVAESPERVVTVLRSRIPRTFIDCNRRVDASAEAFREGRVTPGLMPWIVTDADRALLRGLYDTYVAAVDAVLTPAMPRAALLLLHSYAPREVGVEVDEHIVANLRAAYTPEVEPTWPLRPEVDVITRDLDGRDWSPVAAVNTLRAELAQIGVTVGAGATYPLHPSTLAHGHVLRWPGRALCVEVRRDLLAEPFEPFAEMHIGAAKLARLAGPFAAALGAMM